MNFAYGVIAIVGVLAAIILGFIAVAPDDIIQPRMIPVEEMVVVSELTPEPEAVEEESIDDIVMEEEMMMQETMEEEIMMKEEIEEPEGEQVKKTSKPGKYIASKTGTKFHAPKSEWGKKIKKRNAVWFDSKEEAMKSGYNPGDGVE